MSRESLGMVSNTKITSSPATALTLLSMLVLLAGVISISAAAASRSLSEGNAWFTIIGLSLLLSPLGSIRIPGVSAHVSLGDMVSFTCAALFGPAAGILAAAVDGFVISLRVTRTFSKFSYNVASNSVSMALSGAVTAAVFPWFGASPHSATMVQIAGGIAVLGVCYSLTSTLMISAYLSIAKGMPFLRLWKENSAWTSISFVGSAAAALGAFVLADRLGYQVFLLVAGIMAAVSFFYRSYSKRVEKAKGRVESLEALNFRTIEAMITAMGSVGFALKMNVRRVQRIALELGRAGGCTDDQLSALGVAAMLHDIGYIALPRAVLEKPGNLTSEEYEQVKTHSELGARVAESIGFPANVALIIRHHHERYDGTGYPDGLKGRDIPQGARILAIVDCYNALTVDRPHRNRMSRTEALELMKPLAGKAFDPDLFERFLKIIPQLDEEACRLQSEATAIIDLQSELQTTRRSWQAA